MSLTYASLFTGGGLSDAGAAMAGLVGLFGVEMEAAIAASASANLGHIVRVGKVESWTASPVYFDKPDLLLMSPVCIRASQANQFSNGESSVDITAARAAARFIYALQPKYIIIENVAGYRKFESFKILLAALEAHGYFYEYSVLNAADFGVPQSRRRLIVRAVRGGLVPVLPAPEPHVGWLDAVKDLLPNLPESKLANWQLEHIKNYTGGYPLVIDGTANYYNSSVTIRTANQPMFTISANGAKRPYRAVFESGRVLQFDARCLARLQTLPDTYVLPEDKKLAAKIIGNGVPCLMMQKLVENLTGGYNE